MGQCEKEEDWLVVGFDNDDFDADVVFPEEFGTKLFLLDFRIECNGADSFPPVCSIDLRLLELL